MKAAVLFVALAAASLAGCGGVDPDSPLGKRQAIFKDMLKTSEELGGMLRGRVAFDGERFAAQALRLDELSRTPWQHFPQVRDEGDSRARDEVWQRQARFTELARALEAQTLALRQTAGISPLKADALREPHQRVENACRACHEEFRAY